MAKYTYELQGRATWGTQGWVSLGYGYIPMQWGLGYVAAHRDGPSPRIPVRLLRSDGRVMDEDTGSNEVSVGMVAGAPTAEQYELAAALALARARGLRAREKAPSPKR